MSEEYYFDKNIAQKAVNFFPRFLKLQIGNQYSNKPFNLLPWERDIIWTLYGTRRKSNGSRRYKKLHIWLPSRSGKSIFVSSIICLEAFLMPDAFGEILCAANDKNQAGKIFRSVKSMIQSSPVLKSKSKIYKHTIETPKNTFIKCISCDANLAQGYDASVICLDELAFLKDRDFYDTLITRFGSRQEYLFITISTAGDGSDTNSIGKQIWDLSKYTLEHPEENPSVLPVIFAANPEDDWTSEEVWLKANPSLALDNSGVKKISEMRDLYTNCARFPFLQSSFKRYQLNLWCQMENKFIQMDEWNKCSTEKTLDDVKTLPSFIGIDLSSTRDYSAVVILFVDAENSKYYYFPFSFIPQDNIYEREQEEHTPVREWVNRGFIIATPGNSIDYDFIREMIIDLVGKYQVSCIAYDPWGSTKFITDLQKIIDTPCIQIRQNLQNISEATKYFQRQILRQELRHPNNPLMNWMAGNATIYQDANNNIRITKSNKASKKRIDCIAGSITGLAAFLKLGDESPPKIEDLMFSL